MNAIRSPMAEGIFRWLHGNRIYVESVGVHHGEPDPFAAAVMTEIGIDIAHHAARVFEELEDGSFDVVVSLSPEAQHKAVELTRTSACEVEFWPTFDPSLADGNRETRLATYRAVRDQLMAHILRRFPPPHLARE